MSASGPVEICNAALLSVASNIITSFDDGTNESKVCAQFYPRVRDSLTAEHEWSHAIKLAGPLPPADAPPVFEYSYQYLLPADLLRLVWASESNVPKFQLTNYRIAGRYLMTDLSSGLYIRYIARSEDTTAFSQMFTEALIARLSAEFAIPLAESRSLSEMYNAIYRSKLEEAIAADGLQGRNQRIEVTRHVSARYRGPKVPGT